MNDLRIVCIVMIFAFGQICQSCNSKRSDKNIVTESISKTVDYGQIGNQLLQDEKIGELKIGLSVSKTINLLGEPSEKSKLELWGADGEYHHTLIYKDKGIEIDIVGENDSIQKIGMITVTEPCTLTTKEKVGIGSSVESIKTAYKNSINPEFTDSTSIVAGSIYGGIIFKIKDDKVNEIFIGAAEE